MSKEPRNDTAPSDPQVLAAWRAASVEEPPARVDAAILAAARAAVRNPTAERPSPARDPWWHRWQPLAAAAAVTGLAFVLLQSLPREHPVRMPSVAPAPPAPATREMATPAEAPELHDNEERPSTPSPARSPEADAAQPRESAIVPVPMAAPEPTAKARQESAATEPAVSGVAAPSTDATDMAAVAAERPAAPAARGMLQGLAGPRSADAWVARIVDRHAAGDLDAAATDLRAFRATYPDADSRLPESLRDWAATVTAPESP
jgi:hypothetical protein